MSSPKVTCTNTGGFVEYSYDLMDRLTNIVWNDSSTNTLRSFAYAYSPADVITNVVYEDGDNDAYLYDDFDRLTNWESYVSASTSTWTVAYDRAGNIETEVVDQATTNTWTYGLGNRVSSWGTGTAAYFDDAGCVTTLTYSGSLSLGLTWNGRYQLTAVATNGVAAERNGFDALGRRVWNWDGTETNYFVYDGQQIIADVDSTGGLIRTYTWGPGIDNLLAFTTYTGATAVTYYPLADHLGTVHALADETGTIVESYRFDAWGRVLGVYDSSGVSRPSSVVGLRYLWQGREYSWSTSLYYFRARWYDPVTGRWLSKDPIGISGGLNQYVAFANNPIMFMDPFGLTGYFFINSSDLPGRLGHVVVGVDDHFEPGQIIVRDAGWEAFGFPANHLGPLGRISLADANAKYDYTVVLPNKAMSGALSGTIQSDEMILYILETGQTPKGWRNDRIPVLATFEWVSSSSDSTWFYCSTYAAWVAKKAFHDVGLGLSPSRLLAAARRKGYQVIENVPGTTSGASGGSGDAGCHLQPGGK